MTASPTLLCPACQTPLPPLAAGGVSLRCPVCQVEVDAARVETLVGKPRFVAERSWTGVELDGMLVEEVIGAGGMGTVYRARAPDGESRAVKFLSPSLAAEPEIVERFRREVSLLEKLDHPGIVKVKARGERDGLPWFAMELVEGPTLAARLGKGPLSVEEARTIFARLLVALDHAHQRGVVHRDLKPANVLLAVDGARLADFGIARLDLAAGTRKTQLTRTDAIIGTFSYMSPEQRAGRPVDARSDLYSVGVMLYEALAGERPEGAFPPLAHRRPEVPSRVDQVVRRLLQPVPGARFASAAETGRALAAALARPGLVRRPVLAAAAAAVAIAAAWAMLPGNRPVPVPAARAPAEHKAAPLPPPVPSPPPAQRLPADQVVPAGLPPAQAKTEQARETASAKATRPAKRAAKGKTKGKTSKVGKARKDLGELFFEGKNAAPPSLQQAPAQKQTTAKAARPLDEPVPQMQQAVAPPAPVKGQPRSGDRDEYRGRGKREELDFRQVGK